ncbi:MAG: hypothetical protein FWF59_01150 [Turicibacter sp.]|nr:hypothetical protein [Turicibacter sp.]
MTATKEAMQAIIQQKREGTKSQGKKKRPAGTIGEPAKRKYNKKPGGLFDK